MDILALKAARNILHDNPEAAAAARRAKEGEYKGPKELFNMDSADYGRLEKLIKMNDNRIRSRRRDIGKTKEQLILKYKGYLEGTGDTDGQVLPEWRIDNRQTKLEAQGITLKSAPSRASEAIARTREKYLQAFLADGNPEPSL